MDIEFSNIIEVISSDSELTRMLPIIEDISIIEYDGKNIGCSCAIAQYMIKNGINTSVVSRIVLFGKKTSKTVANEKRLLELYPNASISIINQTWHEFDPKSLNLQNTLIFHAGLSVDISDYTYDQEINSGEELKEYVNLTRSAYYVCILNKHKSSFWENPYVLRKNLRLKEYAMAKGIESKPQTNFCKNKHEFIVNCIKTLIPKDAFFQCIDEVEHGCEECNQCENYGIRKQCPFAQKAISGFYRKGYYVPKNERIAHQWEVMASRQGYKPACIQVADDLKNGYGCKRNIDAALKIYTSYASQIGNEHCIEQILDIAEHESSVKSIIAIPYIAQQALDGNEEMIIKLSDAFQNSDYGLPKDMTQQKEWIHQGAENGNPRFVLAMAEMYEKNSDWKDAYEWYKKLEEVAPELSCIEKLEEIELKMLTNGSTADEVAISGENYLFGYFQYERNLHLAYRCLKYATNNNVPFAKGLLGTMYVEGLGVEEDFNLGINLLTSAAENNDLYSMDKLTDLHYSEDYDYNGGLRWENILEQKIEEEILKDKPYAFYLKGHYQRMGYLYPCDENGAFENINKAAELNIPIAQYELYELYDAAVGCECDITKSNYWLKTAADNGYYKAEGKYGIELFGENSWFNPKRLGSFKYLAHAYDKGYEDAYWYLAQCYMYGYGTPIKKDLAYPLYKQAAENGILKAQEFLCTKYFKGDYPLPKDYKLCAKWGEEAISQGCKSVRFETAYSSSHTGNHTRAKELYLELANEGNSAAMNNYACELDNPKDSAEWFQKAADKGDDFGLWNIAKYYKNGTGVDKDIDKAIECFTLSANKGNKGAIMDLARMYRYGDGVDICGMTSVEWYKKAADNDEIDAILAIAEIYSEGQIIPQNLEFAIHYYKKAAEKDNSTALFKLGELYEDGLGVEKNIHTAIYWYRKAASKNNYYAKDALKRLNTNWINEDGNTVEPEDYDDDLIF